MAAGLLAALLLLATLLVRPTRPSASHWPTPPTP